MNNNEETKIIKIGRDVAARTSEDHTLITVNVPIDISFSHGKTAEEIEEIAFDEIDVLAVSVADQTKFIGNQLVSENFSHPQTLELGDALQMLGKFGAGLQNVSNGLLHSARHRQSRNAKLVLVTENANAETNERKRLFDKFTTTTGEDFKEETTDNELLNLPVERGDKLSIPENRQNNTMTDYRIVSGQPLADLLADLLHNKNIQPEMRKKFADAIYETAFDDHLVFTEWKLDADFILKVLTKDKTAADKELEKYAEKRMSNYDYQKTLAEFIQLPTLIEAVLNHPDIPTRFWNTIFNAISLMSDDEVINVPLNSDDISRALGGEQCRALEEVRLEKLKRGIIPNPEIFNELNPNESIVQNNPPIPITTKRNKTAQKKKAA